MGNLQARPDGFQFTAADDLPTCLRSYFRRKSPVEKHQVLGVSGCLVMLYNGFWGHSWQPTTVYTPRRKDEEKRWLTFSMLLKTERAILC